MRPLHIDFSPTSPKRTLARTGLGVRLAFVASLIACMVGLYTAIDLLRSMRSMQDELSGLQAQQAQRLARNRAPKKMVIPDIQVAAVNGAVAQLNLPWRDVFNAIEAATPNSIALLAIEPDAKHRVVRGTAEAKNSDAMIGYVEQLKQQAFFTEVVLTKHETNEQDPNKPFRFQFEARWTEGVL